MMIRNFRENGGMWIMKPIGRAQGKGIFIASKPSQIESWMKERGMQKAENCCYENFVAQRRGTRVCLYTRHATIEPALTRPF